MRKLKFMKTLLVAAGLAVGASVWADETRTSVYSNNFESSSDWTAKGKTDGWTCNPNATTANTFGSKVIGVGAGTGDMGLVSPSFSFGTDVTIVDVEMKFKMDACTQGKSSGIEFITSDVNINNGYVSSGAPFFAINASANGNGYWGTITVGGSDYKSTLNQDAGMYENNNLNRNTTGIVVLNVRFNFKSKTATFALSKTNGTSLVASTSVAFANTAATTLDRIFIHAGKTYGGVTIDDVSVYKVTTTESYADYTVHFVDKNGNKVKEDVVRNGVVGATVNANNTDKTTFIVGDNKFNYNNDGGGVEVKEDGTAELTVTYDKITKESYVVKAQVNGVDLTTLTSGKAFLDGSETVFWNKFIKVDGASYETNSPFGQAVTSATIVVAYTACDAFDYLFEAENMNASRTYGTYSNNTSYSNGGGTGIYASGTLTANSSINELGLYTITVGGIARNNSTQNYLISYSTDNSTWNETGKTVSFEAAASGTVKTASATNVQLPAGAYLRLVEAGNNNAYNYLDYVMLTKTTSLSTLASGSAVRLTFDNATTGTKNWDNWVISFYNANGTKVAQPRADWYDDIAGNSEGFTYGYTYSSDGGATADNTNVWASFQNDMTDADIDLTLSYNEGTLYVIGTMTHDQKVYYVNYKKTGLTGDLTYNLYGNNATLSNITTADATVTTAPAHPAAISAGNVGATGYSTFTSIYPLDLSTITGATAYYASAVDETKVKISSTTASVPAGEGLLLKGTANDAVKINIADDGTAISGNKLVGCVVNTNLTQNENYYVLVNNGGTAEFQCLDQNGATIPAGKAYLNAGNAGARLSIINNEETSISSVENVNMQNVQYYNLNGQRMLAPQKGLYIVNGKKVVLK